MIEFSSSGEIDKEVSETFRAVRGAFISKLNNELGQNCYGETVTKIFMAPIIRNPDKAMPSSERTLFKKASGVADYRLNIDFKDWIDGDNSDRELLLVNNLVFIIRDLQRKLGKKINGDQLIQDIAGLYDQTP